MLYRMNEGKLPIPDHWRDDSVNVFTIDQNEGTNLVISRQRLAKGTSGSKFINDELDKFDKNLNQYKKLGKQPIEIDGASGVKLEYTFKSPEGMLHQITTLLVKDTQYVAMTYTHSSTLTDEQKEEFLNIIQQYTFEPIAGSDSDGE